MPIEEPVSLLICEFVLQIMRICIVVYRVILFAGWNGKLETPTSDGFI